MSSPLHVDAGRSWPHAVRSALYDALHTRLRGAWLVRLAFAVFFGWAGLRILAWWYSASCVRSSALALVVLVLALVWLVYPLVVRPATAARAVTFHDEGLSVESAAYSLSFTWSAVRSVRRTPWDLVVVLDGMNVSVPRSTLPPGAFESVTDRLRRARQVAPPVVALVPAAPYRSPEALPRGPEDEEASPEEWASPVHYRVSVLAFPTAWDHVASLVSLKRDAFKWPALVFMIGSSLIGVAVAPSFAGVHPYRPLAFLGGLLAVAAVAPVVQALSPSLFALRDRFVSERRAGVLYAVGPRGLYSRTQSFERRDGWSGVLFVRASKKRVSIFTASMVHVIPTKAFESVEACDQLARTVAREIVARRPPAAGG